MKRLHTYGFLGILQSESSFGLDRALCANMNETTAPLAPPQRKPITPAVSIVCEPCPSFAETGLAVHAAPAIESERRLGENTATASAAMVQGGSIIARQLCAPERNS